MGEGALRAGALRRGDRLPPLALPSQPDGALVRLRAPGRSAPVVVFVRSADSEAAAAFVRRLAEAKQELRVWLGRPLVVVPDDVRAAEALAERAGRPPFPVLADADGEARGRAGLEPDVAALVIADRWGAIYSVSHTESEADLPPAPEILEWLRFLATQCPECGVPDEPGRGEWAL